jgi:hypothetical protein
MCGLNFKSKFDTEYLYNWGKQYLKYNINKTKKIIKKIYNDKDISIYTHTQTINKFN